MNVVEREVDLFVIGVKIAASCVGYSWHRSKDEGNGTSCWDCRGGRTWGVVKQGENAFDCDGKGIRGNHRSEESLCSGMLEIADLQTESGQGKSRCFAGIFGL